MRVTHRDDAPEPDSVRVSVRAAGPDSRWTLTVEQYQGDQGQVILYPSQTANDRGRWHLVDTAFRGYLTVEVRAESRAGQRCEVSLSGRVSRL